ncbi:MAG: GH3 auxin-responsive promoter family protein, partial [Actinomycetota bacterium]
MSRRFGLGGVGRLLGGPLDGAVDRVVGAAFSAAMVLHRRRYWPVLTSAAERPADVQRTVLAEILDGNATTTFGRAHGFDTIDGPAAYRRAVPVQDYESLRPLIEEQERTGRPTLTAEQPVLYAQTSGTSGSPKYLPLTESGIERAAGAQRLFAGMLHRRSDMFAGKIVGIGSPAVEGHLPGGTPFGSASGLVYEQMPSPVRRKYVLGPEILAVEDHELRYLLMAAFCLAEREVSGVATANPSTLLRLRRVMLDEWDAIVEAIDTGHLVGADRLRDELGDDDRRAIVTAWSSRPARARELRDLWAAHGDDIGYRHLWPRLGAIATWTGGSAGFALSALRPHLAPGTKVAELGYSASEMRATIGIDPDTNRCLPLLFDNYYEFVPVEVRDGDPTAVGPDAFIGIDALEVDAEYYVYVTTRDGLYRYDMNDIVAVTGFHAATPTLRFVRKGRGVTNITGEKLTESQLLTAVGRAADEAGVIVGFFVALADEADHRYRLYLESPDGHPPPDGPAIGAAVDRLLADGNIEY